MTPSPDQPSRPLPAPMVRVVRAEVTEAPVSVTELADAVQDAAAGAVVTFEGVVRNHDAERAVTGIGYSCHPTAGQVVKQIAQDVAQQGRVRALGVVHRVGDLSVGEVALAVAVSSDHRAEAFAVCSQIVEEVKERLDLPAGTTLAALREQLSGRGLEMARVIPICSFLVNSVSTPADSLTPLADGDAVDVLPPFAGG